MLAETRELDRAATLNLLARSPRMQSAYEPPLKRFWAFLIDNSLLLVMGALAGLLWANVSPDSYTPMAQLLHFAVKDLGMVFFLTIAR